jgi:transposase-like protein
LAYSKVELPRWIYLMRELDKKRSVNSIAKEIEVTYKTALGMAKTVREQLYQQRHQWEQLLSGEVEDDDVHLKGGQQGREVRGREPRERGLKERGRGTYAGDRPLVCLWGARDGPGTVLELRRDAGQRALFDSAWRHIAPGSRIDTDTWNGYNLLDSAYDHRTVKHSEEYVTEEGVHCNTAEGEWSIFKPWWRRFRGVAKRHLYLYLTQYAFARTYRERSSIERLKMMLGFLYAFLDHVLRIQLGSYAPSWAY